MIKFIKSFAHIFSRYKLVDNRFLNLIGVQPFRLVLAKVFYSLRSKPSKGSLKQECDSIDKNGMVMMNSFLSDEMFAAVTQAVHEALKDPNVKIITHEYGPNKKNLISIQELDRVKYKPIFDFLQDERVKTLFEYAERRKIDMLDGLRMIEHLVQGEDDENFHDVETELHSDIHYNTNKSWLYLTDVTPKHAPLVYVPESNNLKWGRLKYVYRNSIQKTPDSSRRISEQEMNEFGFKEMPIVCNKNTFVLANTFGYHRRLKGEAGQERIAIIISERVNPYHL